MNARLVHDAAVAMSTTLLEIVENCIREEEKLDAFQQFYQVSKAGIEAYHLQFDRMQQRLKPSSN